MTRRSAPNDQMGKREIRRLTLAAHGGDRAARDELLTFAYFRAERYYKTCVRNGDLNPSYVYDLCARVVLDLDRYLPRMEPTNPTGYISTMIRSHLFKHHRNRLSGTVLEPVGLGVEDYILPEDLYIQPEEPRLSDDDLLRLRAIEEVFSKVSPKMQQLIAARMDDDPPQYSELSERLSIPYPQPRFWKFTKKCLRQYQAALP